MVSQLQSLEGIACIDISNPDEATLPKLVRQACMDVGVFYVVNHGLDKQMAEVFQQSRKFFSLPMEEKMKSADDNNRYMSERICGLKQDRGHLNEGCKSENTSKHDIRSQLPLHGPNVWPSPDVLPGWKETMEAYRQDMLKLAITVMRVIAIALDLDAGKFGQPTKVYRTDAVLRLLKYTAEKPYPDQSLLGAGARTDWGILTLLSTDDVPGLQLCKDKDAVPQVWTNVPPIKGGFIVKLGGMLERWSNNVFRSTQYRFLTPGSVRYSVRLAWVPWASDEQHGSDSGL